MDFKIRMMQRAKELALCGRGFAHPGPMVGAVLAREPGEVLAEGYYQGPGHHAESRVLEKYETVPTGAVLFVTLEPCSVRSGEEDCCALLLRKKVRHLVVGSIDKNPYHLGVGLQYLREQGVVVELSPLEPELAALNEVFFYHITHKTPYVALKAGLSLDGKIALQNGRSQWITGAASRTKAHHLRQSYQAIMVGGNTIRLDNPHLNVRLPGDMFQPIRIVCSLTGSMSKTSYFLQNEGSQRLVVCGSGLSPTIQRELENTGVKVLKTSSVQPNFKEILPLLYSHKITSLLLEGGAGLYTRAVQEKIVQTYHLFIAPKVLGSTGLGWVGDLGTADLDANLGQMTHLERFGQDVYVEYKAAAPK